MKNLNVDKVELDELWTFVKKKHSQAWITNQKNERWIMVKLCTTA
jgi:hypothetical protein